MSIPELSKLIDEADAAYYKTGTSILEDAAYDKLRAELEKLDPLNVRITRVGASVRDSILEKRVHRIHMGSQFKAMNREEYMKWIGTCGANKQYHASFKMDGSSGSFEYFKGRLVMALTRGDGVEGEDITANALQFQNLPPVCKLPGGEPFTGFVRGEIMLLNDDWEQLDPDKLTNPRNKGTGVAGRKNGEDSELLSVYAFRIFDMDGAPICGTQKAASVMMTNMGFMVAPFMTGNAEEVWDWYEETQQRRAELPYWIDGIIVSVDDMEDQMSFGQSDNRPKGQIAIKFEAEEAETIITDVIISVGHTGAIIPTACLAPTKLGGSTITSATLCNWDNIRALNVCVGDRVTICKAGDIIPRILDVTGRPVDRKKIVEPTICPECGEPVTKRRNVDGGDSTISYCTNTACAAQVFGKIEKFVKSVNILGVGEQLIRGLIREMNVVDAADLYALAKRSGDLGLVMAGKSRLGSTRARECLANIEKARKLTLAQFLGALGIFGLGKRRVALIQAAAGGEMDTLEAWLPEDWPAGLLVTKARQFGIPNLGARLQPNLIAQKPLIDKFLKNGVEIVKPAPKAEVKAGAFTICITGALSRPKAEFWKLIQEAGHVATDDFSKLVTHLVAADTAGTSNKLQKARKTGIPILDESQLLALLKNKI